MILKNYSSNLQELTISNVYKMAIVNSQRGFEVRWRLSSARRFSGSFGLLESASDTSLFDLVCADYFPRAKLSLRRENYWSHTQKRVRGFVG